jgi:hypothetical protein
MGSKAKHFGRRISILLSNHTVHIVKGRKHQEQMASLTEIGRSQKDAPYRENGKSDLSFPYDFPSWIGCRFAPKIVDLG